MEEREGAARRGFEIVESQNLGFERGKIDGPEQCRELVNEAMAHRYCFRPVSLPGFPSPAAYRAIASLGSLCPRGWNPDG